jgi:hypothetical protein
MKPNATHTAHALSELLETDRSTMIRCLRSVPPDAQTGGKPTWKVSTAAKALEAHHRKSEGGNSSGGTDPALMAMFERLDAAEDAVAKKPTLDKRRQAARELAPLIDEMERAVTEHGRRVGIDPELTAERIGHMRLLHARGLEASCSWSFGEALGAITTEAEDA